MFLSDISIKRPVMMSMFLIVFVLFGTLAYLGMNLELTPSIDMPMITVQTIYPGASPEDLETQVSKIIEDETASISGIDNISSYSMESVSFVMIAFDMDKDVYLALQEVKDKVDGISNILPKNAETPLVKRYDPLVSPAVEIILSGPLPITRLYDLADKFLSSRFGQIEGVANVGLTGGQKREIKISLDSKTLSQMEISLFTLNQIIAAQNMDMPGGSFERRDQEYSVRLSGRFETVETIRNLQIPTAHGLKRLGDLADVRDTGKTVRERTTYYNNLTKTGDKNVIQMSLMKTSDGNAVNIHHDVVKLLPQFLETLPAGCALNIVNESASFTESSVTDTLTNIFLGIVLTSLILLFFLHDYKSTIIVALSMPMSLISTFLFMKQAGFSLNIMSLMGLSTAVGILVTNSVVVLENIFRHKTLGHSNKESAAIGTSEITMAVLASAGTNLVVFLPLAAMSSIAGRFFAQFSLTVVIATVFSILMSFTLTPMMASLILPEHDKKKHPVGKKLEAMFHSWENSYQNFIKKLLKNKKIGSGVIALSLLLLILSLFIGRTIGFEFMPSMDEGLIQIKTKLPTGYKLAETAAVMTEIESHINKLAEVSHQWTRLGRQGEADIGVNKAILQLKLIDRKKRQRSTATIIQSLINDLSDIPNARIAVSAISMSGGRSDIEFNLQGTDLDSLEAILGRMTSKLKAIPGLINLNTSSGTGKPEITLEPDRIKLANAGLTMYDLAMALRTSIDGMVLTYFKDQGEEYDIRVSMNDKAVDSPAEIGAIPIVSPLGTFRLDQLAKLHFTEGFSTILHRNRMKNIQITSDVGEGYTMGDIMKKIDEIATETNMPPGYGINWGGMSEQMGKTVKEIAIAFIIAIILTYMLLAAILESLLQPVLILGTIPLALIGVFTALALTGLSMNIISMLAIVMLIGIVVNNAILLLDYTNQLVRQKGMTVHDALVEACPTKLRPIIMSTLAIILGMLPMALGLGSSGREIRQPMGVVSIGGLLASTLLSLVVIPVLYNMVSSRKNAKKSKKTQEILNEV